MCVAACPFLENEKHPTRRFEKNVLYIDERVDLILPGCRCSRYASCRSEYLDSGRTAD